MLELGKAGSAGTQKGERPVLRDGALVAVLRASKVKEAATATVGDRSWTFTARRGELTGRRAEDPAGVVRFRARRPSFWRGTWTVDVEGTTLQRLRPSVWKGAHTYVTGDREVARSGSTRGWSPRPVLEADGSLPLDAQVFLLWLELVLSRRDDSTAAAAAAGGAAAAAGSG